MPVSEEVAMALDADRNERHDAGHDMREERNQARLCLRAVGFARI